MSFDMDKLIAEINKFTELAKMRELTPKEKAKREALRRKFLEIFKGNFENKLKNIKFVDKKEIKNDSKA